MSNIKADTLSTLDGTKSITTDRIAQGVARAWVNFNGTGTVAIRASFNVSSITDNGVGDYTVNFTAAMPDTNYATFVDCITLFNGSACAYSQSAGSYVTGSVRVLTVGTNESFIDASIVSVSVQR